MAGNNIGETLVGAPLPTGGFYCTLDGTLDPASYPTDASTALPAELINMGYVAEGGVSMTLDRQTVDIKAWGGDTIRKLQESHSVTMNLEILQAIGLDQSKLIFGEANVTEQTGGGLTRNWTSETIPQQSFALEMKDGNRRVRLFGAIADISVTADVNFVHNELTRFNVQLECIPEPNESWKVREFILPL